MLKGRLSETEASLRAEKPQACDSSRAAQTWHHPQHFPQALQSTRSNHSLLRAFKSTWLLAGFYLSFSYLFCFVHLPTFASPFRLWVCWEQEPTVLKIQPKLWFDMKEELGFDGETSEWVNEWMMTCGSSANCRALQFGAFSTLDDSKAVEMSHWENKPFPNNEVAILGRWIAAGWAGKLEAQKPARRLFGKVGFRAAHKRKKSVTALPGWPSTYVHFHLTECKVGNNLLRYFLLKLFFLIDTATLHKY